MSCCSLLVSFLSLLQPSDTVVLHGQVTDPAGKPLQGAVITLQGTAKGCTTDAEGFFRLQSQYNDQKLSIRYIGYADCDTTVAARDATQPLKFTLHEQRLDMDEVVVTGTRTPRTLKNTPIITKVITAAEIRQTAPQSLIDVLQNELPGIEFTRTEGVTNSITFQGLDANYLLILVDGERLAGETSRSNPDFNRIDIDNIERIEVVKGAMSTLYGSGAVAGVVNIITRGADRPFGAGINAQYDSEGEQKYGFNVGTQLRKFSSYTSGVVRLKSAYTLHDRRPQTYYYEDGTAVTPDSTLSSVEIEGYRNFTLEERLGYRFSERFKASARGSFYQHERFNAGMVGDLKHDLYRDWNAHLSTEFTPSQDNRFELSYHFDNYTKYDKFLKLGETERNYRNLIHNPRLLFSSEALRNNTLVAGAEALVERLDTYQFADTVHGTTTWSLYVQDDYRLGQHWSFQGGLRLDHHSAYGLHLNPKLSAMAKAGSWTFRAGYAAGFRAPTLKELYTSWDHQGMFELVGNRNLRPEKSHHISASTEYARPSFNVSLSGYYNKIYDKISMLWNMANDTSYYANTSNASTAGFDIDLRARIGRHVTLRSSYAYVRDRQMLRGRNTSSTRPHSATIRIEYTFRIACCPFTAGLGGRILSKVDTYTLDTENDLLYRIRYPAYSIWKLNCSGQLPRGIRINVGIDNLLNYKPDNVTYNAGITRGTTFFASLSIALDELCNKKK